MASGVISKALTGRVYKIEWSSKANNATNTSTVTCVHKLVNDASYSLSIYERKNSCTVGDDTQNFTSPDISTSGGSTITLGTTTHTVAHNADGTKSVTITGVFNIQATLSGEYVAKITASGTAKLDDIPKATTINSLTCSTAYLDGAITATYTPQSSSYYNRRLVYLVRGGTLTLIRSFDLGKRAASKQTSTINFSESELSAIYAKVTDTITAKIRVTFRTYSNSAYTTKVGSDQYLEISLTIPTSVAPTATLTATPINNNSWIKGLGIYASGLSGVKLTLAGEPGEGASVASNSITADGNTYNADSVTISTLDTHGDFTFTAKVVDSRRRSKTATVKITVLQYSAPSITSLQVERGTYSSGWTASDSGPDVRVLFKTTLKLSSNGNTYSAAFQIDGTSKTPNYGTTSGLASGASRAVYFYDVDAESSHTLKLTTTDKVGETGSATITIPTTAVTMEFNASGKGIAFGKTSEQDAFECAWPAYFSSAVYAKGFRIPEIQCGSVTITPSGVSTPTSAKITFEREFSGTPVVVALPVTSVPGTTVTGVGVTARSSTGCTLWVTRTNTTATVVNWIAIY